MKRSPWCVPNYVAASIGRGTTASVAAVYATLQGTGNACTLAVGAPVYLCPGAAGYYVAFVAVEGG